MVFSVFIEKKFDKVCAKITNFVRYRGLNIYYFSLHHVKLFHSPKIIEGIIFEAEFFHILILLIKKNF